MNYITFYLYFAFYNQLYETQDSIFFLVLLFHGGCVICLYNKFRSHENPLFFLFLTERLWIPSGPINGGCHAWCVLHHGPAMVCGCHCPLHHSCQQPKTGIRMFSSRRTAQIPWHSGAKSYRAYDFYSYGFISLYDQYSEGNKICLYEFERRQNIIYYCLGNCT